jgi:hypothetical protein
MRRLTTIRTFFTLLTLFAISGSSKLFACDLTNTTLISVVPSGGNFILNIRLRIGAGRTGAIQGADNDTQDIIVGIYRSAGPLNIVGFTPANITSLFRNCTMPGSATGAIPFAPFNSQEGIYYQYNPGNPGCTSGGGTNFAFACVTSAAQCSTVHQNNYLIAITIDRVPDSLRVFGVEGAGNPTSGCYPNPNMKIDFTVLPVIWADFQGQSTEVGNQLEWSTEREVDSERFEVMRSADGSTFTTIGTVQSQGDKAQGDSYRFVDANPIQGFAQYKVRQYDIDGRSSETEVISLTYTPPARLAWSSVGPQPANDHLIANFVSEKARNLDLVLVNTGGQVVLSKQVIAQVGSNSIDLGLNNLSPGMYFLRLQGGDARLDYKLMKL